MEEPSVSCVSYTLKLAVLEGLLSQCSITHSPANTRKVEANVVKACRIRKSHMKVYTLFQQNKKKLLRNSLDAGAFFLNAAVLSRKILVSAKYRIGIRYRQILNIKGLG